MMRLVASQLRVDRSARQTLCLSALLVVLLWSLATLGLAQPYGYSVNSRGNFPNSNDVNALWRINLADGSHERVSQQGLPTGFLDLEALAINQDEQMFGADDDLKTLVRVSMVTGVASAVGGTTINMGRALGPNMDFGMTFDCKGQAFVVSDVEASLYRADTQTGTLTLIGEAGGLGAPITDIATYGDQAFGIGVGLDADGNTVAPNLYAVDLVAATASLIGPLGSEASPYNNAGLSFDEAGGLWAITDRRQVAGVDHPSEILKIDPATGLARRIATTIVGLESLAIAPPSECGRVLNPVSKAGIAIPVATPWGLLALGLLLMLVGLRQAKQGAKK